MFKTLVSFEFVAFSILIVIASLATLFFQARYKRKRRYSLYLESMLIQMINEQIDMVEENIPADMLRLHYVIPVIEKIENIIRDPFWDFLKHRLIDYYLRPEILAHLFSDNWIDIVLAIRTIRQSPQIGLDEEVLRHFASKHSLLRFATLDCAIQINTMDAIYAIVHAMAKEPRRLEYPYRDALLFSNKLTLDYLNQIYRSDADEKVKLCCLKVLSLRVGYIDEPDILREITSDSREVRWWAVRAIENCPTEETVKLLRELTRDAAWEIRSIALFVLASLKVREALDEIACCLTDSHEWVRFMSALSLKYLGAKGLAILRETAEKQGPEADISNLILAMPERTFEKGLQKFFPINQDPLLLMETIETK